MTEKTYNGWTNYETWLVNLWMDSEEGTYNYWRERTCEMWEDCSADHPRFTRSERARIDLADCLKDRHEEICYESIPERLHASFIMDLLNGALSEVNWHEIAEHLLEANVEEYARAAIALAEGGQWVQEIQLADEFPSTAFNLPVTANDDAEWQQLIEGRTA